MDLKITDSTVKKSGVKLIGATCHYVTAVLARGLRYHLEDRVLVHGNKTVVFR